MFDLIIRGGTVYDGAGRPGIQADVAVSGGKIAAVEPLPAARAARVIDARGRWVTPGFIDIHRHADAAAFRPGFGELELRQGLTTIVNGNCGLSCAPVGPENLPAITSYLEPICGRVPPEAARETLAEYFAAQPAAPLHTGMLAGAWPGIRCSAWSRSTTPPFTGGWRGLWPTGPWACPWAWAMRRSASIPPTS